MNDFEDNTQAPVAVSAPSTIKVVSTECTHIVPDLGVTLIANVATEVPAETASTILSLPGVTQVTE